MKPSETRLRDVLLRCVDLAEQNWEAAQHPSQRPPAHALGVGSLPVHGVGIDAAIEQFSTSVLPYLVHTTGPRFFGFVTGGITPASLAGDWLASAIDQLPNPYDQSISTQLTDQTIKFLLDLFALPRGRFDGTFTSGTSVANLIALTTARQFCGERVGVDVTDDGARRMPEIAVYAVAPHISIIKALGIIGLGRHSLRLVDSLPGRESMDPSALERMCQSAPEVQKIVVASAGTVSTGDFDDLRSLREICNRHGAWLHVDGAFGLFARCSAPRRHFLDGLEDADSIAVDMHKWLNVPYDCGLLLTQHVKLLEKTHRTSASYFFENAGDIPDYSDRGLQLSMRFRALPTWMTLRAYGRAGVESMIDKNCSFAERLGTWMQESGRYELLAPVRLNIVLFRGRSPSAGDDGFQSKLIDAINQTGRMYCSPGRFQDARGIRIAVCNWRTGESDLDVVKEVLAAAYDGCVAGAERRRDD